MIVLLGGSGRATRISFPFKWMGDNWEKKKIIFWQFSAIRNSNQEGSAQNHLNYLILMDLGIWKNGDMIVKLLRTFKNLLSLIKANVNLREINVLYILNASLDFFIVTDNQLSEIVKGPINFLCGFIM